jgi:uncharacterized protein (TIGR03790 family)
MRKILQFAAVLILGGLTARSQSYNDVLVVVNSNSALSQNVGNYFKTQRSIPTANICSIAMPQTDEIDSVTYVSITSQIKSYLTAQGLTSSINYIVTTQGVPLKVRRSSSVYDAQSNAGSFDSDLCLLGSSLENQIGKASYAVNPYRYKTASFSRSSAFSNIRLVTRLAGYTYNDIVGLIDRARQPYNSHGVFVLDADPARGGSGCNVRLQMARDTLLAKGYDVVYDATSEYVVNKTNVLGYVSWGSNDANWSAWSWKAQPHNNWSAKALAETYVSSSGRTFSDSTFVEPTIGWQSLVADLIHENGVTGVKGYVYEPYTTAMAMVDILYGRWTSGYNLAESYYSASTCMGWMDVVIGDPKATLAGEGHLPVELVSFSGSWLDGKVTLRWKTVSEVNNYGFEVQRRSGLEWQALGFVEGSGTVDVPRYYAFADASPFPDANTYRLKQIDRDGTTSYSSILQVSAPAGPTFALGQNYPNPCRERTAIPFTALEPCSVSIEIYSSDGRLISRLATEQFQSPGKNVVEWRRQADDGTAVPAGAYFYRFTVIRDGAVLFTQTKQMLLVQ